MISRESPIERLEFDTQRLMTEHPPMWRDPNKRAVSQISCPPGSAHRGRLVYSRWRALSLPAAIDLDAALRLVESREDVYDYCPALEGAVEWHVNFADPHLFVAYGSSLFAQDEMQVAEHPALGALLEALQGRRALTVEGGEPTPVLVTGVERRCRIATDPNPSEDRPDGLYGNCFARASLEAVRRATTPIVPPTRSNILAIAAPRPGYGKYDENTISYIFRTAFSGFRAAWLESHTSGDPSVPVVVHTGFWGCGAFGGNRVLMALLQIAAASAAHLDKLIFHTFNQAGSQALDRALDIVRQTSGIQPTSAFLRQVEDRGFAWGVSDGN